MRVLLNALQAGNRSGTGRYVTELARWLPGLSTEWDFVVLWPKDVPHHHLSQQGQEAFLMVDTKGTRGRLWYEQFGVRTEQRRTRANLVHFPANFGALWSVHNMVVTVHDVSFLRHPAWFRWDRAAYYRQALKWSLRCALHVIADSEATAQDLEELARFERKRIAVVPLGVGKEFCPASDEACRAVRAKYGLPERFFLFAGTIEPRKNLVRVIRAWEHIAEETDCDLVLAGRGGWKVGPICKAAALSPHTGRIHFPGFIAEADLPALLSAAHALVWPSLYEGFGLPPLEAMACGLPVLTSNVSSLPEAVGEAALTVDPTSEEAIAEGMMDLATNDRRRAYLRERGLHRAAAFTWERTARQTLAAYETAIESKWHFGGAFR